jgi:hypothetical protein
VRRIWPLLLSAALLLPQGAQFVPHHHHSDEAQASQVAHLGWSHDGESYFHVHDDGVIHEHHHDADAESPCYHIDASDAARTDGPKHGLKIPAAILTGWDKVSSQTTERHRSTFAQGARELTTRGPTSRQSRAPPVA